MSSRGDRWRRRRRGGAPTLIRVGGGAQATDGLGRVGTPRMGTAAGSAALDHPVYDCLYLALAEAEDARLVTADQRLLTRLRGSAWEELARPLVPA